MTQPWEERPGRILGTCKSQSNKRSRLAALMHARGARGAARPKPLPPPLPMLLAQVLGVSQNPVSGRRSSPHSMDSGTVEDRGGLRPPTQWTGCERPRYAATTAGEADTKKTGNMISTHVRTLDEDEIRRITLAITSGHIPHIPYTQRVIIPLRSVLPSPRPRLR